MKQDCESTTPTSELFKEECPILVSQECELGRHETEGEKKEEECKVLAGVEEVRLPSLGELKVDEEDDGLRTPTSLDHMIPVSKQCPPAPRKPKSLPTKKRKASSNVCYSRMELIFPPLVPDLGRKIKKSRVSDSTTN
ncbi:hypothetical protein IFM89_000156 [Coptis chinensis]|uniref:Uncharacterized protein n=1 Tax=Coptis chinensis TaxID=261450 RepID=A0A835H084_9MAGN|nr:hypothetical protein IFM89_000156 [Coptis chinensis]